MPHAGGAVSKRDERDFGDEPPTTVMRKEQLTELTARTRCDFPKLSEAADAFSDDPTAIAKLSAAEILAAAGETIAAIPPVELEAAPEPAVTPWQRWQQSAVVWIATALVALLAVLAIHD